MLAEAPLDHLLDDLGGLALLLRLRAEDLALLLDLGLGDLVRGNVTGRRRGDLHREIARELFVAALELDEHADAPHMHISADGIRGLDDVEAAYADVLTDIRDQPAARLLERLAYGVELHQRVDVARRVCDHGVRDLLGERAEVLVLRDE